MGASAGGLEALKAFVSGLPAESPLAFVVVQHLPPGHRSRLAELLAGPSALPVKDVADGERLLAGQVYVGPPGTLVTVGTERLHVRDRDPEPPDGGRAPIDRLLESMAQRWGERSAAVVLSGRGSDGSQGLRVVREAGGFAVTQTPGTAAVEEMPRNALATGLIDGDAAPSEIAPLLHEWFDRRKAVGGAAAPRRVPPEPDAAVLKGNAEPAGTGSEEDDGEVHDGNALDCREADESEARAALTGILALVRSRSDHDFRHYKSSTLMRRVRRRMSLRGVESLEEYRLLLADRPEELNQLVADVLICVTSFFRNPAAWAGLEKDVLPRLCRRAAEEERSVRIWSAGCATGEEAYTLAMLAAEAGDGCGVSAQVFATDVSETALAAAREGVYPLTIEASVTPARLGRFFFQEGDVYRVSKLLRQQVVFARHDLTGDPPFSSLDLIVCRNLLIYLEPEAQDAILRQLHFALRPGGCLFLGASESATRGERRFEVVSKKHRLFRRPSAPDAESAGDGGEPGGSPAVKPRPSFSAARLRRPLRRPRRRDAPEAEFRRLALETGGRAAVLVRPNFQILFSAGPVGRYLQVPPGAPTDSILEQARPGLRSKLRGAIHAASRDGVEVVHGVRDLRAPAEEGLVGTGEDSAVEGERTGRAGDPVMVRIRAVPVEVEGHDERLLMVHLTDEPLVEPGGGTSGNGNGNGNGTATDVARVRQLEEELEELRRELSDTIDQLETANEDLEGAHEEALSMNEELQSGNEELEAGREELQSLNEELTTLNTQLETKVDELEGLTDDLQNLLTSTRIAVVFLDSGLRVRRFTEEAGELFHLIRTDVGRPIGDLADRFTEEFEVPGETEAAGPDEGGDGDGDSGEAVREGDLVRTARAVLSSLKPDRREVRSEDGRWFLRRILPYRTRDNRIEGVAVTFVDVSELKRTQAALAEQERLASLRADEIESIYQHAPVGLAALNRDLRYLRINDALAQINGAPVAEHLGRTPREVVPGLAEATEPLMQHVLRTGEPIVDRVIHGQTRAEPGRERVWEASYYPLPGPDGPDGEPGGISVVVREVTELQALAEELRRSEERLRRTIDGATVGIAVVGGDGEIRRVNDELLRTLGLDRDADPRRLAELLPEWAGRDGDAKKALTEGRAVPPAELRLPRADGSRLPALVSAASLGDDGNGADHALFIVDLTELRAAEARVRRAAEVRRLALHAADLGTWQIDGQSGVISWDERSAEVNELPGRSGDLDAVVDACVHPEDRARVRAEIAEAFASGAEQWPRMTFRLQMTDGRVKYVTFQGCLDGPREESRVVGVVQDVTASEEAARELARSEQRLRLALDAGQLGTWEIDLETMEASWDDRTTEINGLPHDRDGLHRAIDQCVHPDDRAALKAEMEAAIASGAERWEPMAYRIRPADGGPDRYVVLHGRRDAAANRIVGVIQDVTASEESVRAVAESENRLRLAVTAARMGAWEYRPPAPEADAPSAEAPPDGAPAVVWERFVTGPPGKMNWSEEALRILGLDPAEGPGPDAAEFLAMVPPADYPLLEAAVAAAVDPDGDGRIDVEHRVVRPDGETRWIAVNGEVTFEGQGTHRRPVRHVGTIRDVTDLKRAERELRSLTEDLERRVAERTDQLRRLAAKLTAAEQEERRRIAYTLHDHFQQLLVGIKMWAELAREGGADGEEALERLAPLVDEAIDASRTLAVDLCPPVLYDRGLAEALQWLGRTFGDQHRFAVAVSVPEESDRAERDRVAEMPRQVEAFLFQSARELLLNALKHSGGQSAAVALARPGGGLTLTVRDRGRGCEPEELLEGGPAPQAVGGFGLASIRERVELLGGTMTVRSAPGDGMAVTIALPAEELERLDRDRADDGVDAARIAADLPRDPAAVAREAAPPSDAVRALLVDDHRVVRSGLASLLALRGGVEIVGEASDGLEAVERAKELRPDVVVMDVSLPKLGGVEATARIVREVPGVRVVGLSMHSEAAVGEAMRAAGAERFLNKTGPSDLLIAAVRGEPVDSFAAPADNAPADDGAPAPDRDAPAAS
ncbi:CheR family methyltransferase [Alienimonas sp. DA493]|uniref:CheR family methyltransferase n=1 Tax=Alienimonas sp. DA493 TaxID=3373605 RepID=UPI0037552796